MNLGLYKQIVIKIVNMVSGQMTVEEVTFNQYDRTKEVTNDADDRAEEVATILPRSTRLFYHDLLDYFTTIYSTILPRSTQPFYHDMLE